MTVVVTEFHFLQIKRELFFRYSVEFDDPFLGECPETFQAVDVHFAGREPLFMIHLKMLVSATHERVITAKLVRINDRSATHSFNGQVEQRFAGHILNGLHFDDPVTLQNAEYRHFSSRPPTSVPLALAAEIRLVHLDDPLQQIVIPSIVKQDRFPQYMRRLQNRRVADPQLPGDLTGGQLQFE